MLKPRVKTAHRPILRPDGKIWIGSLQYGLGTELDDDTGLVWPVCQRMDGTLSRDELVSAVAEAQGADAAEVADVVGFLAESGWTEDAGAPAPDVLSGRELERYERSVQFQSWIDTAPRSSRYELQARLKKARVTVLGVGGIGSAVAASLTASGVGRLHCVDFDVVELGNLNRQLLYTEADVGRPKAEVAAERLRRLNSDVLVSGADLLLSSPGDVAGAVRGSDVFVLSADSPEAMESWANSVAVAEGIPMVTGAYTGPMLCVSTVIPGVTGCYECLMLGERERMTAAGTADLLDAEHKIPGFNAVMAPTSQMVGHFIAMETLFLLWGMPVQTAGRRIHRNFLDYDHQYYIEAKQRADCPACGEAAERQPPAAR
jgi:molybdopterin-synthase adenylyltransferase